MNATVIGVALALASGLVWGGGDFSGGLASRRARSMHVLIFGGMAGFVLLLVLGAVRSESWPPNATLIWGFVAGLCGMLGLVSLYHGLANGRATIVAPVSTIVAQIIPVLYSALTQGPPGALKLAGFALAALGVWCVSQTKDAPDTSAEARLSVASSLRIAMLAGLGFGLFFVFASWTSEAHVFGALAVARVATVGACLIALMVTRERLSSAAASPLAFVSGALDAIGNALFLIAKQYVDLGVATVLSSLYPVSTILLSRIVLREQIAPLQWAGIALCAVAVGLIVA
jgi:drug/metabolite transporter (DMT)-like permease